MKCIFLCTNDDLCSNVILTQDQDGHLCKYIVHCTVDEKVHSGISLIDDFCSNGILTQDGHLCKFILNCFEVEKVHFGFSLLAN